MDSVWTKPSNAIEKWDLRFHAMASRCSCNCTLHGVPIRATEYVFVRRDAAFDLSRKEQELKFLGMYQPGPLSENFRGDVSLVGCDQQPVYAHRFVLAGRSTVFRRMFETDMKEKKSGIVMIDDANGPLLRAMVKYCYTADIVFTAEVAAEEVLKVADKYCLEWLKARCLFELSKDINKDNVCDKLVLAELYEANDLKQAIQNFFASNSLQVYSAVAKRLCKR
ncbi:hypothetical protein R1sor_000469 [Riccia sorocarpa]|uniref:BTB domain-containing protein n=1 Tax=Riccia sorocarpa TaxID=122646 RepID=A0ABD3GW96_9MARC